MMTKNKINVKTIKRISFGRTFTLRRWGSLYCKANANGKGKSIDGILNWCGTAENDISGCMCLRHGNNINKGDYVRYKRLMRLIKRLKLTMVVCFSVALASCSGDNDRALINLQSVIESGETKLSELVDSIRFIPLETNDECLIGSVQRIKRRNGRFYIQSDNRLMVFDGDGRFERVVTKVGVAPGEVISILDYDIAKDNNIAVSTGSAIIVFDEDSIIRKIPYESTSIRHTPNGWLAVSSVPQQNGNKMIAFDDNWDTLRTVMPSPEFDGPNSNIDLIPLSLHAYFHQIGCGNELFEYNSESGNTRQYKIIDSPDIMTSQEYADYHGNPMESPKHIIRYITANRDQILLGVIEDRMIFYYLYDKGNKSTYKINVFKLTDDISGIELANNTLLGTIYSHYSDDEYFVSYLFGTSDMNAKFTSGITSGSAEYIDDETNPILVLTKFKKPGQMK